MLRYTATSLADASSWLRGQLLLEVPERGQPALQEAQLAAFEAALLEEITNSSREPIDIGPTTDLRVLRAAQSAGISLDYRWPEAVYVILP